MRPAGDGDLAPLLQDLEELQGLDRERFRLVRLPWWPIMASSDSCGWILFGVGSRVEQLQGRRVHDDVAVAVAGGGRRRAVAVLAECAVARVELQEGGGAGGEGAVAVLDRAARPG